MFQRVTATEKLLKLRKRIRAASGGTSASKTISILMILIDYAQSVENELISVVSESFPHLKRGAIRDFLNIMKDHGYYDDKQWNRTDFIYTFETGSRIEFFSADQSSKVRGPRRDVLFINEANNIPLDTFDQLEVRTRKIIWMDWNPTYEFWFYTDVKDKREDVDFITLTYKDNEALDEETVGSIESRRHNKHWWKVYGEGQLGEVEGRIYTGWQIIDEVPHEARLERRWLDFGYTNDPTAIGGIYYYNGGYILDEEVYRKGLSNKAIADILGTLDRPQTMVVADSAEPKSIDELKNYGAFVQPATKGKDSVKQGIGLVQDQRISVTKRSVNLIREYRSYLWATDKEGNNINQPVKGNDHHLDGLRYAFANMLDKPKPAFVYKPPKMVARKRR